MQHIVATIRPGDADATVANLQDALLALLGRQIIHQGLGARVLTATELKRLAADLRRERVASRFGDTTERIVQYFQAQEGLVGQADGTVDEGTANAINEHLKAIGAFDSPPPQAPQKGDGPPSERVVRGRVIGGGSDLFVRIYDADFRSEQLLGEPALNADRSFEQRYTAAQFARAEKGSADLRVAVCDADGREIASSPIVFNAAADVSVDVPVLLRPDLSEYERYLSDLEPVVHGIALRSIDAQEPAARAHELNFLAGDTTIDRQHIAWLVRADVFEARLDDRPAAKRGGEAKKRGVPAPVFYAWFREGLPDTWDELVAVPPAQRRAALAAAIDRAIVPRSLAEQVEAFLDEIPNAGRDGLRALATRAGLPASRVSAVLRRADSLADVTEATLTDLVAAGDLNRDEATTVGLAVALHRLVDGEAAAADALREARFERLGGVLKRPRDLAALTAGDIRHALETAGVEAPEGTTLERVATNVAHTIARTFHSDVLLHRVTARQTDLAANLNRLAPLLAQRKDALRHRFEALGADAGDDHDGELLRVSHRAVREYVSLHPGLGLDELFNGSRPAAEAVALAEERVGWVRTVHAQNPDLDLLAIDYLPESENMDRVSFGALEGGAREKVVADFKAYQRIKAVSDDGLTSYAILKAYSSGWAIARSSFTDFAAATGLPQETASVSYAMAKQNADEASMTFFSIRDLLKDAKNGHAFLFSHPATLTKLAGFEALFGSLTTCDCEHCQSIFSPAAYFVDLMWYVERFILADSFKNAGGAGNEIHLKNRRPDLWTLPLTCENTNRFVPTLDIVNRILEAYIRARVPAAAQAGVYEMLAARDGSIRQPFVFPLERLTILLDHFSVHRRDIARLFVLKNTDADRRLRIRCALGLSPKEYDIITGTRLGTPPTSVTLAAAQLYYESQLLLARNLSTIPGDVETRFIDPPGLQAIVAAMGVNRDVLLHVLGNDFLNLPATPEQNRVRVDRGIIGAGVQNNAELVRQLTFGRIDRLERFVRLWRHVPWNVVELDYVVTRLQATTPAGPGAPNGRLDVEILDALCTLVDFQRQWSLPVDELCALWDDLPAKDLREATSLFDRIFNQPVFVKSNADRLPQNGRLFAFPALPGAADAGIHARMLAALKVSDQELAEVLAGLDPGNAGLAMTAANLASLHRHVTLARLLGIAIAELFRLIDLVPAVGGSIGSLADLGLLVATHGWITSSGFSLDEVRFIAGRAQPLPTVRPAAEIAAAIVAEVKADNALTFANTVFTQIGLSEAQSRDVVAENLSAAPADGKALEPVPGTASFRLMTFWDPDDGGAAFMFTPVASDDMVAESARAAYELAKAAGADGFARDVFVALGMDAASSGAFVDANLRVGNDGKPFEAQGNRFRLIAAVTADQAVQSLLTTSRAALRTARTGQLASQARAILTRHHPVEIVVAKMAAALQSTGRRIRALLNLVRPAGAAGRADATSLAVALQGGPRQPLDALTSRLARVSVLFKDPAFDAAALAFAARARAVFSLPNPPADLAAALVLEPEAARRATLYAGAATSPNPSYEPDAIGPDRQALQQAIDPAQAPLQAVDAAVLARALQTDRALVAALLQQVQGQLSEGLDGVYEFRRALELCTRVGVSADTLKLAISDTLADLTRAADGIQGLFRATYPDDKTLTEKLEPFEDRIRGRRRDGLVDYLMHPALDIVGLPGLFPTPNALFDFFLIDVMVEGCARTSELVSATSSVQLYVHRVIMHLERSTDGSVNATLRNPERAEWPWRQHYRRWEANRRVYLHPEIYAEPGLRDDKTPLFKELEDTLLQTQVNDQNVIDAYANYLHGFDELSRLRIAGAYHDRSSAPDVLHLFGATASEPPVFYYRTVQNVTSLDPKKGTTFSPWVRVNAQIPVRKISPIVFAGRLFAFWVETTTRQKSEFVDGSSKFKGYRHSVRTKFTQLRLDGRWTPPQTIKVLDDAGASGDVRIVEDPLTGGKTQLLDEKYQVIGEYDLSNPTENATFQLVLVARLTLGVVTHTRAIPRVATWDAHGRDQAEPVEDYSPDGFKWERTYPETRAAASTTSLVTMFVPRNPGRTAVQEQLEVWEAAAIPLANQTSQTSFLSSTDTAVAQGFSLPGLSLPARFDAQVVNGNVMSRVYEAGGDALLAEASGAGHRLWRFSSRLSTRLGTELAIDGIHGMLDVGFQQTLVEPGSPFGVVNASVSTNPTLPSKPFEPLNSLGIYFRELFFHIPFLIADHLNSQQKFAAAQQWYHYLYDPTAASGTANDTVRPWRFLEFRTIASQNSYQKLRDILTDGDQLAKYKKDPFNPHAIARLRAGAYQKAIVMKYIDNLIDWADSLFSQFTMESINEATLLYVMAADILGLRPVTAGPCGDEVGKSRTYQDILPILSGPGEDDFLIEELEVMQIGPHSGSGGTPLYLPEIQGGSAGGAVLLQQAAMMAGFEGAGGGSPNPHGWNQVGAGTWSTTRTTPVADAYGGFSVVPLSLTVKGTDSRTLPLTGDPIEPPPVTLGTIGGFNGNVNDLQLGGKFTPFEVKYSDRDIVLPGRPPDRVQIPKVEPAELVAAKLVFCIPENRELLAYWDRVDDRLYKVRNCMDIAGVRRRPDLFAPEIDPRLLVRMRAAGLSLDDVMNATSGNLPPSRFQYLIEKAKPHAATVQAFGSQLLSALEKRDAEELARLRTIHEQNLQSLRAQVMRWEIAAAEDTLEGLRRQKQVAEFRRDHFQSLASTGLLPAEQRQNQAQQNAETFQQLGALSFLLSAITSLVPELGAPTAMKFGGKQISDSFYSAGSLLNIFAGAAESAAKSAALTSSFGRRAEDWRHQTDLAKREILQIQSQIDAAEIRREIAVQSETVHQRSIEQTQEIFDFLRDRFTNLGRFTWLSSELQKLNRMAFNAALSMVRLVERAYAFERPDDFFEPSADTYWDAENAGLLAGDRLLMNLQQLERRFIETNYRTLEVEQSFSLAQLAPSQLLRLREKGSCTFTVPETAFDLTYPGQYRRRIRAVRVSIPCVTGPYLNVGATLRLTGSRIRLKPRLQDPLTSIPLRHTSTIATSGGQNDAGVFEFSFRDDRYMPFEGAGAISDWQLDLPSTFRVFDYRTISDVVMRIAYTAEEDVTLRGEVEKTSQALARSVIEVLRSDGLPLALSLRHDFPDAWRMVVTSPLQTVVTLDIGERHLPAVLADWLTARAQTPARLSFASAAGPTAVALVTQPSGAPLGTIPQIIGWIGAATPNPLPAVLTFTRGTDGLYSAPLAGTSTLQASSPTVSLKFRLESAGSVAPIPATALTVDENKLRDIVFVVTVKIAT